MTTDFIPDPQHLPEVTAATTQAVEAAIVSRRSVRAYRPLPVPRELIERILNLAARAPSGTNTQPWKVTVLTGAFKDALSDKILAAYNDPAERAQHTEAYDYYPAQWVSPYIDRRRKIGWDMYGLLGLTKDNKAGMQEQHAQNYRFFGAPVGLMFTIDRVMGKGSWVDYGMFLQTLMVAARAHGLDTCPQAAFNQFHRIILPHIGAGPDEELICGMALGYADNTPPVAQLKTEREPASGFTRFLE
ncbi:MAG: nitroreductase [Betaproteobacteria bacterium]|jgi:nitroreductase|nr:nitroreductase [Betaproteobacteria bacterium]